MADLKEYVSGVARAAKKASASLRALSAETKNRAILAMAKAIDEGRNEIRDANARDVQKGKAGGLSASFLDRLTLTDTRIDDMIGSLKEIAALEDPVGEVIGRSPPLGLCPGKGPNPHRRDRHDL